MRTPWIVLQGEIDQVCAADATRAFVGSVPSAALISLPKVGHGFGVPRNWMTQYLDAYGSLAARRTNAPFATADEIRDLALVEVPAPATAAPDTIAIVLTGDGGWADLDRRVAAGMAAHGIPAIGWSSLTYYWTPRTPAGASADLARIIRYYLAHWSVEHVILIGYSFGADVLPFLVNRLPSSLLSHVRAVALLGPADTAEFEFHVTDWIGGRGGSAYRTADEAARLTVPLLCVRGGEENDSACRNLNGSHVTSLTIGHGHHFSAKYETLVEAILEIM